MNEKILSSPNHGDQHLWSVLRSLALGKFTNHFLVKLNPGVNQHIKNQHHSLTNDCILLSCHVSVSEWIHTL